MYGELALNALNEQGISVFAFCDRVQAGRKFCGLPVLSPEDLKDYKEAHVLICATKGFQGIRHYLEELKWSNYYEISDLLNYLNYAHLREYCKRLSVDELIEKYSFYVEGRRTERLDLSFLALSITERCTLKCRKCSVLSPYYQRPCDDDVSIIVKPMERLLACVDSIAEMQIGGGEPFMHRQLGEIVQWGLKQEKIKEISIFTNSTIVPGEGLVAVLKNKKVKLLLDDYGELSRNLDDIVTLCDRENIRYIIQKFERWDDLGDYTIKDYTEEQLEKLFRYCSFGNVMSMMKGKLYRCTTAARIADIGIVEEKAEDYVSFLEDDYDISKKRAEIQSLIYDKKYHNGCMYCNGISINKMGISVAEQM